MLQRWTLLAAIFTSLLVDLVCATHKCIWASGSVKCKNDPTKQANVEIRAYDRDGFSIFKVFDADDLMGVTFTEEDGSFNVEGCGSDMNWFPGIPNNPDPYIRITHYCNNAEGETIELPEFDTFVPNSYDAGVIELDDVDESYKAFTTTKRPTNPANYRTALRKEFESLDSNRALKFPAEKTDEKSTTKKLSFIPHVGIDESDEAHGDWQSHRDREHYTLQGGNARNEITTVTLPDDGVLSGAAKEERVPTLIN